MIRSAVPSDIDDIAALHVKTWQAAYRGLLPDAHLEGLDPAQRAVMWSKVLTQPDALVLVATDRQAVVGFCSILPSRDADASSAIGEITAIYVDPSVWRSGTGSALVDAAVEAARLRSFSELTLWVLANNTHARAFYEALGFHSNGHTKTEEFPGFSSESVRYRRRVVA